MGKRGTKKGKTRVYNCCTGEGQWALGIPAAVRPWAVVCVPVPVRRPPRPPAVGCGGGGWRGQRHTLPRLQTGPGLLANHLFNSLQTQPCASLLGLWLLLFQGAPLRASSGPTGRPACPTFLDALASSFWLSSGLVSRARSACQAPNL